MVDETVTAGSEREAEGGADHRELNDQARPKSGPADGAPAPEPPCTLADMVVADQCLLPVPGANHFGAGLNGT